MLDHDTFDHTGENNSSPGDQMGLAGYPFVNQLGRANGKNISVYLTTAAIDPYSETFLNYTNLFMDAGYAVGGTGSIF